MALCTQEDVEKLLQIDFGNNPDDTITQAIAQATAAVEAYCNQTLETAAGEVTLEATGAETYLFIPRFPVTAVASVVEDDVTLTVTDQYLWYSDGRLRRVAGSFDAYWSQYANSVVVNYTAGWVTVPDDLILAAAEVAANIFKYGAAFASQGAVPIKSVTLDGSDSITYNSAATVEAAASDSLTPRIKRLLTPYVRRQL